MKKILLVAMLLVTGITIAQINLTGVVKDTLGEPLEMANVLAINKATKKMASYGFTDSKGRYKLSLDKNSTYTVKVSYVGMKAADVTIEVTNEDVVKDITLYADNMLDEINIVSKMPVTIKGDTIIYNADSFKNGSERKLEDVLKKIPGVEVNEDGEIEVEGKKVEKVMVEGKDFFDGDSKLATKNIPSNAVDKIQVLRNYNDVNQLRGVQNSEDRVALNIKLKEGKKNFWFGDVKLGGGDASDDKSLYIVQPKLFYYSPKYSINFIGDLNNLGEAAFTRRDYFNFTGGFRAPSQNSGTNINLGNNSLGFLTIQNNRAKDINTKFGAANFSYSPKKTLDINGFAIFSNSIIESQINSSIDYVSTTTQTPPDEDTESTARQRSDLGALKLSLSYKPNVNNQIDYDVIGKLSTETQDQGFLSSVVGNLSQYDRSNPYSVNQNLNYYYTLNETNIFALSAQHLLQNEDPFYNAIIEDIDNYEGTGNDLGLDSDQNVYNINQRKKVKSNQLDAKLDYWNVLNEKSNINLTFGTIYSKQNFDSDIFQFLDNGNVFNPTPTINDGLNSNDTEYIFTDYYLGLHYQFKTGIFTFTPGFTAHTYKAENTQQNLNFVDQFNRVLPDFNMRIQLKQSENITFTYRMQTEFTDVNQLARGIVLNGYNSIFAGNPELESAVSNNINLRYFNFNMFNYTNIFAFINYSNVVDRIRNQVDFEDGSVVGIRNPFNSGFADESLTGSFSISKSFRKLRASFRTTQNYSKFNQVVNENRAITKSYRQSYVPELRSNFREAPNFSIRYSYSINNTNQGTSSNKNFTNAPSIDFDAYIWKKVTFKTDYSYTFITNGDKVINEFDIWNASLAYRKNNDAKWEYEIRATNLLNTQARNNVNNSDFAFNLTQTFIQPRFISFRMIYQL